MIWSNITWINFFFLVVSLLLFFIDFYLIKSYLFILQKVGVTIDILTIVILLSFLVLPFFQSYQRNGETLTEGHHGFALTMSTKLKSQLKGCWYRITYYRKSDFFQYPQYPFLWHIANRYGYCLNIFYIYNYLLYLCLYLLISPLKMIFYFIYFISISYEYLILIKTENALDIYSYNEFYLINTYMKLNPKFLEEFLDEYGNLNWYHEEEFNKKKFIKYIVIWFVMNVILKPYYITFNHFISITYIFNKKRLIIWLQWDENFEEYKSVYEKTNNPFTFSIKLFMFILYVINIVLSFVAKHFQMYKINARNMQTINYINTAKDTDFNKIIKITWLSLQLSNFQDMNLDFWWRFKLDSNFGDESYKKVNFVKRITKDKEGYIYEFPIVVYGKPPNQFCEVFNFVYTILYIKK